MRVNHERLIVGFTIICIGLALSGHAQEEKGIRRTEDLSRLAQCMPDPVSKLFQWPDPSVLSGPNRLKNDDAEVAWPRKQCLEWLQKAVASTWLPPEEVRPIFIRDEFDGRDTVRVAWERNGFAIQVSQTASIFVMRLTLRGDARGGDDPAQKLQYARFLCTQVFRGTGYRWAEDASGRGIRVPVESLSQKIASYSFQAAFARDLPEDHAVWGRPESAEEARVKPPQDEAEVLRQRDPSNRDWDTTAIAYRYWFRMVSWWNDGKTVGFYFLKVEEGPWLPSYDATFDKDFFRVRGPH